MRKHQLQYLTQDIKRLLGKNKLRLLTIVFSRSFYGIFIYRLERSLFIILGRYYKAVRIPLLPIYSIIYWYSNIEIHYEADIKGGINILHPSLGIVISGKSIIGENLTLVGGNCIGMKANPENHKFILGNNITMGVNAIIIGPIYLENNVSIGAGSCVTKSHKESNITLIGTPAKIKC